ncbi:hypothetical protein F4821DRAFT_248554 [Hypoxylon rubiginosum]|uniref:Uncharacterized protein n=1 Tax=Hypoxylon rubiginosum TaxID=110542 RepID=A0ACC0CN53_9PEZI|nr:hypothetical protein F4821DRAFT_248554 [Hypoxylon rubiginosum]
MNSTAFPIRPTQKEKAPANSEALDTGLLETENAAERVPESEAAKWALNMFLSNHELHPFRDINEIDQLKQRPIPDPAALCQGSYVDLRSLEDICRERYDDQGKPKGKMNSTQGKILCMLHIRLICKHVDLYCACRASNATKALRRIPGKYQILSRLWREGIQKPLDGLRLFPVAHKLLNRFIDTIYPLLVTLSRESRGPPEERTQEEGTPKMHTSEEGIHQRKSSQKDLSKEGPSQESTHKEDPSAEENIIAEILGDVSRYRRAYETDKNKAWNWQIVSISWFVKVAIGIPAQGRIWHHIGVVSNPVAIQRLSWFAKSESVSDPFADAVMSKLPVLTRFFTDNTACLLLTPEPATAFIRTVGLHYYLSGKVKAEAAPPRPLEVVLYDLEKANFLNLLVSSQAKKHYAQAVIWWRDCGAGMAIMLHCAWNQKWLTKADRPAKWAPMEEDFERAVEAEAARKSATGTVLRRPNAIHTDDNNPNVVSKALPSWFDPDQEILDLTRDADNKVMLLQDFWEIPPWLPFLYTRLMILLIQSGTEDNRRHRQDSAGWGSIAAALNAIREILVSILTRSYFYPRLGGVLYSGKHVIYSSQQGAYNKPFSASGQCSPYHRQRELRPSRPRRPGRR